MCSCRANVHVRMDHALLQRYRIQLSYPLEIRIVFGQHNGGKVKLRDRQTVFLELGRDFFVELQGNFVKVLVNLKNIDTQRLYNRGERSFYRR